MEEAKHYEANRRAVKYHIILISPFMAYYNPPNNFCRLSLDKTDHLVQKKKKKSDDGYQGISAVRFDICHLI